MKKLFAFCSALLIFAGVKAQTITPTVKKETIKPELVNSVVTADSLEVIKSTDTFKLPDKSIKVENIKKTNILPMKESIVKPDKL